MTEAATEGRNVLSQRARAFIRELLYWDGTVKRAESRAKGSQSSTAVVCEVLTLGVVGTGNSGTKGTGRVPSEDWEPIRIDPVGALKYRALGRNSQRVADAIVLDGRGDVMSAEQFGQRRYEISFLVRVGMILVASAIRERWAAKFALGDPKPAINGAETFALLLVEDAALEWCGATAPRFVPISPEPSDKFAVRMPVRLPLDPFAHIQGANRPC